MSSFYVVPIDKLGFCCKVKNHVIFILKNEKKLILTKLFTVKTIFAFIVLYRCAYNFNFATEPQILIKKY